MKATAVPILMGLAILSGCLGHTSPGAVVRDPVLKAELVQRIRQVHVTNAVFHTLIQWPGREVSLVEIVKVLDGGGLSVAGLTDMGNTLYAVHIPAQGRAEVLTRHLPLSEAWLVEGLMAGLLIPWRVPDDSAQVRQQPDGTWALSREQGRTTLSYLLDEAGQWHTVDCFSGSRRVSRTRVEWDGRGVPVKMETQDVRYHFVAVRERVTCD